MSGAWTASLPCHLCDQERDGRGRSNAASELPSRDLTWPSYRELGSAATQCKDGKQFKGEPGTRSRSTSDAREFRYKPLSLLVNPSQPSTIIIRTLPRLIARYLTPCALHARFNFNASAVSSPLLLRRLDPDCSSVCRPRTSPARCPHVVPPSSSSSLHPRCRRLLLPGPG